MRSRRFAILLPYLFIVGINEIICLNLRRDYNRHTTIRIKKFDTTYNDVAGMVNENIYSTLAADADFPHSSQAPSLEKVMTGKETDKTEIARTLSKGNDQPCVNSTHRSSSVTLILTIDDKLDRDISALKSYFSIHGHFRVPYYYVVPDESMGESCCNSRVRRKKSDASALRSSGSTEINSSVTAISKSSEIASTGRRGSSVYSAEVKGLKLGRRVAQIRKKEIYTSVEHRQKLIAIGMLVTKSEETTSDSASSGIGSTMDGGQSATEDVQNNRDANSDDCSSVVFEDVHQRLSAKEHSSEVKFFEILAALQAHNEVFGDMLVPRYFKVPREIPWPESTWDMQLGNRVRNIRAKCAYNKPKFHQILLDNGFIFNLGKLKMPFGSPNDNGNK